MTSVKEFEKDAKDKDIYVHAYSKKLHLWQARYLFIMF